MDIFNLNYSLSNHDIDDIFNMLGLSPPMVIKYSDLKTQINIKLPCFILYEWEPLYGHWTILFNRNDGLLEFFDSFGKTVDSHLKDSFYDESLKASNKIIKYIKSITRRNGNNTVEVNDIKYQDEKYNTCGKWCIVKYYLTVIEPLQTDNEQKNNDEFRDIFEYDGDYRINETLKFLLRNKNTT